MSTSPLSITLSNETIKKLDSVRGLTKRSTIIESIISEFLDKKSVSGSRPLTRGKLTKANHDKGTSS